MIQPRRINTKRTKSFAVLPYLRTSEPVYILDFVFRSIKDTTGLTAKDRKHLETISSLFFLADHLRITDMVYAVLPFMADQETRELQQKQLKRAQTLLAYLYTSPSKDGTPFLKLEHSSIYLFKEAPVSEHSLWDNYKTENLWPIENRPAFDHFGQTPGYSVILNWTTDMSVVPNSRIYPPAQGIWFNRNQDLYSDLLLYSARPHNWALVEFLRTMSETDDEFSNRIMNALDWYNRSAAMNAGEEVALVNLAIALETLLRLEQGDSLKERFKESVNTLLGPKPQLEDWLEQFYKARSKIVHEGSWPYLMYQSVSVAPNKKQKLPKGGETGAAYGSLLAHGRRVFRLCVGAILSGAMVAEETRLASWFVNNEERLRNICKRLQDNRKSASTRLLSVRQDVIDLHEFWMGSEKLIDLDTLVGAGKLMVKNYLDTNPKIPDDVMNLLQQVANDTSNSEIKDKLERFTELSHAIETWQGDAPFIRTMQGRHLRLHKMREQPLSILRAFLEYAAMPHVELRASQTW